MKKPSDIAKTDVEHETIVARTRVARKTIEELAGDAKLDELQELASGWVKDLHVQNNKDTEENAKKKRH